ncbi:MAG: hypothetical protein JXR50_07670 [Prolixibacteraceae bacterium]|nr:hypothetical protein [Prolixibacteraceae bacterium]MBN2649601.1 hypothetical protein [Prolixibacteraceae bacterium]
MYLNNKYYVIEKMTRLIELKKTGTADEFASKLRISRSQLFIELNRMKSMDVDVTFNRSIKSYVFSGNKKIVVREPIVIVDQQDLLSVQGGSYTKIAPVHFSGRKKLTFAI